MEAMSEKYGKIWENMQLRICSHMVHFFEMLLCQKSQQLRKPISFLEVGLSTSISAERNNKTLRSTKRTLKDNLYHVEIAEIDGAGKDVKVHYLC